MPELNPNPNPQATNYTLTKHSASIHCLEIRARESETSIRANAEVTVRLTTIVELQQKSIELLKKRQLGLKFLFYGYVAADVVIWAIRAIPELW